MTSVPYLLLGAVGFLVYRGLKTNRAVINSTGPGVAPLAGLEGASCRDLSTAVNLSPPA
jgi:hypothetical protein